jgi:hypothetical protein
VGALLSWCQTEVPQGFSISWAPEEEYVLASGCLLGELVEGQALAAVGQNPLPGALGEPQRADLEGLRELEEPDVVGDGSDDGHGLALVGSAVLGDAGQGDGVAVQSALVQALVDDCVEPAIRAARQELVKLR